MINRVKTALKAAGIAVMNGSVRLSDLDATINIVEALDKSVSNAFVNHLKQTDKKDLQSEFERLVDASSITGDDLKDLMYDLEHAGFHNLKKPKETDKAPTKKVGYLAFDPFDAVDKKKYPAVSEPAYIAYTKAGDGWPDHGSELYVIVDLTGVEVGTDDPDGPDEYFIMYTQLDKELDAVGQLAWMNKLSNLHQPIDVEDLEKLGLTR